MWGLIVLVSIFSFINTHPIRPHDFWWHITIGREIINTGQIPTTDIYSYTTNGHPYPSYQMFWLMEILLFSLFKLGGAELVILIHSILITSAYGVIFLISKEISNSWRIGAFCTLFAAALGFNDWNVRPQGISFLLASAILLAIYQYQKGKPWIWLVLIPFSMITWVNSHGTFIIGLVLVGLWFGEEIWRQLRSRLMLRKFCSWRTVFAAGCCMVITVFVCFLNPRGLGIIAYLKTLTGNRVVQNLVTEWAPPTIYTTMGVIFFVGIGICAILLSVFPKTTRLVQVITFIIFAALGLRTSRGIVWFGLCMAPILAERIAVLADRHNKAGHFSNNNQGNTKLNVAIFTLIVVMGVFSFPWFKAAWPLPQAKAGLFSAETPISATEVLLNERLPKNVFHTEGFGSYLIWSAYPEYRVFVDPRIELYPEKVWIDYINISNAVGDWEHLLQEYDVNTLLLNPQEQPTLIKAIQASEAWTEIYADETALLYTRR